MAHSRGRADAWCTRCSRPRCRADAGRTVDEHQRHVSELWSRFAAVAAGNPHAWSQTAYSRRRDPHGLARQPHGVLPVPEAHVRQHRRRPGRRGAALLVRGGAAPPASPTTAWCSCTRRPRRTTTTSSPNAWSLADSPAIAAAVGDALAAAGDRRRRHRALRPLLVLPVGGADRDARARHRRRRSAPAHRHRRSRLRGRPGQQLPDARDRAHGRACCAPIPTRSAARPRSAGTSRSTRPAVWSASPPAHGVPARRPRDQPGAGRRAARAASRPGSSTATSTIEATSVAFERDGTPVARHRDRAAPPTAGARSPTPATPTLLDALTDEAVGGRAVRDHQRRHDEHGRSR